MAKAMTVDSPPTPKTPILKNAKQVEDLFQTMANSSPIGIYITQNGKFQLANPRFQKLTGYTEEELLGTNSLDLVLPKDREKVRKKAIKMLKGERTSPYQFRVINRAGETRWVMETVASIQYQGKRATLGNYMDITKRREKDERIQQQNEFLNNILDALTHPFYVLNANDYTIKMGNLATKAGDLDKNPTCYKLTHHNDKPCQGDDFTCPLEEVKRTRKPVVVEHIHYDADGNARNIEVHGYPIFDAEGNVAQMIEYSLDVTERKRTEEALRESEEFRSSLLANSPNPIGVINSDSSIRYVNPALEKLTGFTAAELIGKKAPHPYWTPETLKETTLSFRQAMYQGDRGTEQLFQKKNGERFWVKITSSPVMNNGEFKYLLTNWVDITKRKKMEEAIRQSEEKYRSLFELAPNGIITVDHKGFVTSCNAAVVYYTGYPADEIVGKHFTRMPFIKIGNVSHYMKLYKAFFMGQVPKPFETDYRTKDGERRWVLASVGPVGKNRGFQLALEEITEHKQTDEALQTEKNKLQSVINAITDGLTIQDKEYNVLYQNELLKKTFGDHLGKKCYQVYEGKDRLCDDCPMEKAFKDGKSHTSERKFVTPSGEVTFWENIASPIRDARGNIVSCLEIARDITERKHMEEHLMLTDRLASIGELASGIAHELNNPLTSVIGFSQLMLEENMPENLKEDLGTIYSEAQRASTIVKNLLTFARKHAPMRQITQVNNILEDVLKLRSYEHKVKNIELKKNFSSELPEIMLDYFQMEQVFLNLIVNAESAMLETNGRGKLVITTSRVNHTVRVSIADNGPGIAKENLRRVFDPFFTTKEVGKGTGLGLSICHGIVTSHGGKIYAQSEAKQGAEFVVELPINGNST